ncbi:MAG: 1,4-dihydroxy-6-naphthoate synthase [Proteobacteria bacterium]|nr:1,4-dihydroxy-6-naphthoate synthase [Pseudomonadota bacterium]
MNDMSVVDLDLAFSPCPNDTFVFHALVSRCVDTTPFCFNPCIEDVEELNRRAFACAHPLTKLSFYAYLLLKDSYELLDAGAALGYGCGPMLVARGPMESLKDARIAVPGEYTTAYLLFQLWQGTGGNIVFTRFDDILPGIASGKYDAGLIIHEGRFVYPDYHCVKIIDLGQWWESQTGFPIPLGCIALRRDMSKHKAAIETLIRGSIGYARKHPHDSGDFIKGHAQELDEQVIADHISLYVNEFTLSLGRTGMEAVEALEERSRDRGLL